MHADRYQSSIAPPFYQMKLSVVIPAYNEEAVLAVSLQNVRQALESNSRNEFDWEIVVCDNNSTDRTAEIAEKNGARVEFEPVNQISRARNTGARVAVGQWLLFIDADSHPPSELIANVLDLIDGGQHIGCGSTIAVEGGTLFNKLRLERLNPLFCLFRFCGGVFILCEHHTFDAIGGFSESLYAFEEIDFVARLKRYGRRQGKPFAILHRHPVITSGRKGDYSFSSLLRITISNVAAAIFLLLSTLLPQKLVPKPPSFLLDYWYRRD